MILCHAWALSARPSHIHTASMAQKLRSKIVRRLASRRTVFAAKLLPLSQPLHEDTHYSLLTIRTCTVPDLGLEMVPDWDCATQTRSVGRASNCARAPADLRPSNTASRCARADGPRSGHLMSGSHSMSHSTCMSGGAPRLGPHSTGLSGAQAHVCMLLQIRPNKTFGLHLPD